LPTPGRWLPLEVSGMTSGTNISPNHLAEVRLDQGLSREGLAVRAGLSARTIYAIEVEGVRPQRATCVVLGLALGCDPDRLFPHPPGERVGHNRGAAQARIG
jgi:DNA-binding XRE family transcriptional regulator